MTATAELTEVRLGFIPLNDCAPLAIAREKGFFAAQGLDVTLAREVSWANIRDKVAVGALDGAHMLGPMPLAASLGLQGAVTAMIAPMSLSLNGAAVTASAELMQALRRIDPQGMAARPRRAGPLKQLIEARRAEGLPSLVFATVFPFSSHNYELRYWMAEAGIDPDRDVRLVVVPPPRMAEMLRSGGVDGYCVGEPWNALSVQDGVGEILIGSHEIWGAKPDKVFGVTAQWALRHPATLQAILRALLGASSWLAQDANRDEAARILSSPAYVDAPEAVIRQSILGSPAYAPGDAPGIDPDFTVFSRYAAAFPWVSHALWFLSQMLRWGQIADPLDLQATARAVYRPDLYRSAAAQLGLSAPLVDAKSEGVHASGWSLEGSAGPIAMRPDRFLDERVFDPDRPLDYLKGFSLDRIKPSLAVLAAIAAGPSD